MAEKVKRQLNKAFGQSLGSNWTGESNFNYSWQKEANIIIN